MSVRVSEEGISPGSKPAPAIGGNAMRNPQTRKANSSRSITLTSLKGAVTRLLNKKLPAKAISR